MLTFVLTFLSAAVLVGAASTAHADDCLALGGNPAFLPGECRIDAAKTASDAVRGGPFTISEPLRITGAGSIPVPAAPGGNALTLNIAGGLNRVRTGEDARVPARVPGPRVGVCGPSGGSGPAA